MILRATAKAAALLGTPPLAGVPAGRDDWYLNQFWVEGRKCLLLVHAETLFPVFVANVRKVDVQPLQKWLGAVTQGALREEGLPHDVFGDLDGQVTVAKTASRSVLGYLNDMAALVKWIVPDKGGLARADPADLNGFLRDRLFKVAGRYVTPRELVARRLAAL